MDGPGTQASHGSPSRRQSATGRNVKLAVSLIVAGAAYVGVPATAPAQQVGSAGENSARLVAAVAGLMVVWWVTQLIPLALTALLPVALFPLLGVCAVSEAAAPYANPVVFLFLGGFMLATAMQRWNVHRRIALRVVLLFGTRPRRLVLGFMLATAAISWWASSTAIAVMMLPIGVFTLGLLGRLGPDGRPTGKLGSSLMLGIVFAVSLGSFGTIVGSPPNALAIGLLEDEYGISVSFAQWMAFGIPLSIVGVVVTWWVLTFVVFREPDDRGPARAPVVAQELARMGPMGRPERLTLLAFGVAIVAWIVTPLLWPHGPVSSAVIAVVVAIALFLIPARRGEAAGLLDWSSVQVLPWGVLFLLGGGLSVAQQITDSGLTRMIAGGVEGMSGSSTLVLVLTVATVGTILTEFTSNTAAAAMLLPVAAGVAEGAGISPLILTIPVALAATSGFMLPAASPPNAVATASGYVAPKDMLRAGLPVDVAIVGLIVLTVFTTMAWVMGSAPT